MGRFARNAADTVGSVLAAAVAGDPTRPLLTYYDDASGERTELSGATLDNWVAKTANLLVDGCGLGPGDLAVVDLPPHWQSAGVLLGCWSVGLLVEYAEKPAHAGVVFAAADRVEALTPVAAPDRFVLGLDPMALPMRQVPDGFADYAVEVRAHGDHFSGYPIQQPELIAQARERAAALGVPAGGRVLVDADRYQDPLDWLLAPLVGGATIVLCRHLDPDRLAARRQAERVTAVL
jgi:uncharacterized protein (TIGR03089 family)